MCVCIASHACVVCTKHSFILKQSHLYPRHLPILRHHSLVAIGSIIGLARTIHIYTMHIRCSWQGNHQINSHIWCTYIYIYIYMVLANHSQSPSVDHHPNTQRPAKLSVSVPIVGFAVHSVPCYLFPFPFLFFS